MNNDLYLFLDISYLSDPFWWIAFILSSIFCYIIGSLNGAQIYTRFIGQKDILLKRGSKSHGSTNIGFVYGKKEFYIVFFIDSIKTILSGIIIYGIMAIFNLEKCPLIQIALIFSIIGHIWPVFFNFNGGKGIASMLGFGLIINWIAAIISIIIYYAFRFSKTKVITTTLTSLSILTILIIFLNTWLSFIDIDIIFQWSQNILTIFSTLILFTIILIKHLT